MTDLERIPGPAQRQEAPYPGDPNSEQKIVVGFEDLISQHFPERSTPTFEAVMPYAQLMAVLLENTGVNIQVLGENFTRYTRTYGKPRAVFTQENLSTRLHAKKAWVRSDDYAISDCLAELYRGPIVRLGVATPNMLEKIYDTLSTRLSKAQKISGLRGLMIRKQPTDILLTPLDIKTSSNRTSYEPQAVTASSVNIKNHHLTVNNDERDELNGKRQPFLILEKIGDPALAPPKIRFSLAYYNPYEDRPNYVFGFEIESTSTKESFRGATIVDPTQFVPINMAVRSSLADFVSGKGLEMDEKTSRYFDYMPPLPKEIYESQSANPILLTAAAGHMVEDAVWRKNTITFINDRPVIAPQTHEFTILPQMLRHSRNLFDGQTLYNISSALKKISKPDRGRILSALEMSLYRYGRQYFHSETPVIPSVIAEFTAGLVRSADINPYRLISSMTETGLDTVIPLLQAMDPRDLEDFYHMSPDENDVRLAESLGFKEFCRFKPPFQTELLYDLSLWAFTHQEKAVGMAKDVNALKMALGNFRPGSARLQEYLSTLVDDFFHLDSQTHPLLALTRMLHPFTHRSSDIQQFPDYFQRQQRRQNQIHMRDCLELAREALAKDPKMEKSEPVACIITDRDGKMLTQAVNIKKDGMFEHAEMLALRELVRQNHGHLPYGIKLYVTMEPCMECWSQMRRAGWVPEVLVYASKTRLGAFSNHFDTREGYHELMKPDFQSPSVKNANIRQARENQARIFYHEKVNWKGTVI